MTTDLLDSGNYPHQSDEEKQHLQRQCDTLLETDLKGSMFSLLAGYTRILTDNGRRDRWPELYDKLTTLFRCGKAAPLDGPMFGVSVSLRDSDFLHGAAELLGEKRSAIARLELMATTWNATFARSTLWTGKTFEPVAESTVRKLLDNREKACAKYTADDVRIGRNFFRNPPDPNLLENISLPLLTSLWALKDRPRSTTAEGFLSILTTENLAKERVIPYRKTGGYFLGTGAPSVVPEERGKKVYQLDYRWGGLKARFPMTTLVDELVQIAGGLYLGQLVMATKNFSVGAIDIPLPGGNTETVTFGREYDPFDDREGILETVIERFTGDRDEQIDYGYQNNGYFIMMDPACADQIFADDAFPELRPVDGEN